MSHIYVSRFYGPQCHVTILIRNGSSTVSIVVNPKDKELQLAPRVDMIIFSTSVPGDDDNFESANLKISQTEIHFFL